MRATLIHNPSAGDGRLDGATLRQMLVEAGLQVRYRKRAGDWRKALRQKADLVIAAGGDGTVSAVALALSGSAMPLAILPLGMANNIGRALGVHGDIAELARAWQSAQPRPLDLGVISASWGEERFVESAGGGLFSHLIAVGEEEIESAQTLTGAEGDRALLVLKRLIEESKPRRWQVDLDGVDLSGDYIALEAMNIRFVGPKVPLAADADPADGLLDVVLVGEHERAELLDYVSGRLADSAAELPRLPIQRGRHLRVRPPTGEPMHAGDSLFAPPKADKDEESSADETYDILLRQAALMVYR
jgi:diacylglycerol kinase family enzyme